MRIIAGRYKRRVLASPPQHSTTRPLPDRVRESLFNLLRGHFDDASVFDGFAGVGSFGLEALSRGANHVVMVERDKRVASVLQSNIDALDAADEAMVVTGDALGPSAIARCRTPINIAFLDPPYAMSRDPKAWPLIVAQMSRLATHMAHDGYLMVRTPWPFDHIVDQTDDRPELIDSKTSQRHILITDLDELDDESLDQLVGPQQKRVAVDLHIPGCIGPETHAYGSTAIHLYMRAPNP